VGAAVLCISQSLTVPPLRAHPMGDAMKRTAALALPGRRDFAGANSLAVGPTGPAVFVTGFLGAHDGCCNFGTVAYQP